MKCDSMNGVWQGALTLKVLGSGKSEQSWPFLLGLGNAQQWGGDIPDPTAQAL